MYRFDTRAPIPRQELSPRSVITQSASLTPLCNISPILRGAAPPEVNSSPLLAGPWAAWGKGADGVVGSISFTFKLASNPCQLYPTDPSRLEVTGVPNSCIIPGFCAGSTLISCDRLLLAVPGLRFTWLAKAVTRLPPFSAFQTS